eukprot:765988-Hanusia_phi.AAC.36
MFKEAMALEVTPVNEAEEEAELLDLHEMKQRQEELEEIKLQFKTTASAPSACSRHDVLSMAGKG